MYKNILLPTDGSALSEKAVKSGIELAHELGSKVTVLTASEPFIDTTVWPGQLAYGPEEYRRHSEQHAQKILSTAAAEAAAKEVPCETVHVEHVYPYQAIIDTANAKGCDLIVMASHGRRGFSAVVLGSETVKVLTHSTVPVLVCR